MSDELLIARNPDPASSLPFLVRVPLAPDGLVLKTRETWPRTSRAHCHRATGWPADAEVLERLARPLAEDGTYRFLGAALQELRSHAVTGGAPSDPLAPLPPGPQP